MWLLTLLACGGADGDEPLAGDALTYYRDAKPIIDQRCGTCHREGDVGPFPLTTAEEVAVVAQASALAISSGRMPPFLPSHDCNSYRTDIDLSPDEEATLLAFFDAGAPAGDPAEATPSTIPDPTLDADLVVSLPEAYTPTIEPDDYRCQLVDLDLDEPTFVTGFQVWPDQRSIVHHTIVFVVSADQRAAFEAYDAAEDGPGWTCFGGPNGPGGSLGDIDPAALLELLSDPDALAERTSGIRTLGGWVPGAVQGDLPPGTGLPLNPGDSLVVQMHYNTLSASPLADRSQVAIKTSASVDYPAVGLPLVDLAWPTGVAALGTPMDIPANDPDAHADVAIPRDSLLVQQALAQLGASSGDTVRVHGAGVHMHALGTDGRVDIERANGEQECIIHYPDWDFAWQGAHQLSEPTTLGPDDVIHLSCRWDNSPENQVVVDGEQLDPRDVTWGEGTTDEMCLGNLYLTL